MNPIRLLAAGGATTAGLALLAYLSAMPLPHRAGDSALLRLSWSARPERIEVCRAVSAEDQARVEEHMRQRVVCEGTSATYLLRVEVNGQSIGETILRGAGLRHDRPIYLLRGYPMPIGLHQIRVSMTRRESVEEQAAVIPQAVSSEVDTGIFAGRAQREVTERARQSQAAVPSSMVLDTAVLFSSGHVTLVTLDSERKLLRVQSESSPR